MSAALDGKQASGSYAASVHTHGISDVTGLQTALDGKQAAGSYAAAVHTHGISDVTGLQTALDGKQASGSYAAASHGHVISDVTGLQTALDGKAAVSHTHSASDLTSGTLDAARLPFATTAQAQDALSTTVAMNPARALDQTYNVYQIDLSQSQVFSTGNGTVHQTGFSGGISVSAGNASGGGTIISRHGGQGSPSLAKWNGTTGNYGGRRINWTRRLRFRARVNVPATLSANAVFRCLLGKIVSGTGSAGALASRGFGFEIRGSNALWLTAHNGTARTDTNASFSLFSGSGGGSLHEIVAESDGSGNVTLFVDGVSVATSSGGPSTDDTSQTNESYFSVELVTTDSSAVSVGIERHPQLLRP